MDIAQILRYIPDYQVFYTVDELDQQTRLLAEKYPDVIHTEVIGTSRQGHPIQSMVLGHGPKNALCFACPHPTRYLFSWRP